MLEGRVRRHVEILGAAWLALSGWRVVRGIARLAGAELLRWASRTWLPDWGWPLETLLPWMLSGGGMTLLVLAAAGFVVGYGLLRRQTWARVPALILAFLALLDPLLGTALGVYTLWVLLPSAAAREYRELAGTA